MPENEVGIRVTADASGFTTAMSRVQQTTREANEQFTRLAQGGAKQAQDSLGRYATGAGTAHQATTTLHGSITKLAIQFSLIDRAVGATLSGLHRMAGGLVGVVREGINLNIQMTAMRSRLENIFQSTEKASRILEQFRVIAAKTPFAIRDVTEAGVTLAAFLGESRDRVTELTPVVADLAAFMGTSIPEAASAFGRAFSAGAGAADILRERGILPLVASFSGVKDLTKLTLPEFQKVLVATMTNPLSGIAGSTERMSKTVTGALSNVGDAWDELRKRVTESAMPAIERAARAVISILEGATTRLTGTGGIGAAFDKIADTIVRRAPEIENAIVKAFRGLGDVAEWIAKIDFDKLTSTIKTIATIGAGVAGGKIGAGILGGIGTAAAGGLAAAGVGGTALAWLGPIGIAVGAIGGFTVATLLATRALNKLSELGAGPDTAQRKTLATLTTLRAQILSPIPAAMMPGSTAGEYSVESAERERLRIGRTRNEAIAQMKAITGEKDYAKALAKLDEYIDKASISFGSLSRDVGEGALAVNAGLLATAQAAWDAAHVVGKVGEILRTGAEDEIEATRRERLLARLAPEAEFSLTTSRIYERARREPAALLRPGIPEGPLFETTEETRYRRADEAHREMLLEETRRRSYKPPSPTAGTQVTPERGRQLVAEIAYGHAVEETRRELEGSIDLARSLGIGLFEGFQKAGLPLETLRGNLGKVNEVIAGAEVPLHAMLKGISENNAEMDRWTLLQEEGKKAAKELREEWEQNVRAVNENILAQNSLSRAIMNIQAAVRDASKAVAAGVSDWRAWGSVIAETLTNLAPVGEQIKEGTGAVIESIGRVAAAVSEGLKTSTTEGILAGVRQAAIEVKKEGGGWIWQNAEQVKLAESAAEAITSSYQDISKIITDSIVSGLSDPAIYKSIDDMMDYLLFRWLSMELTEAVMKGPLEAWKKAYEEEDEKKRAEKIRWAQEETVAARTSLVPDIRELADVFGIHIEASYNLTKATSRLTETMIKQGGILTPLAPENFAEMMAAVTKAGIGVNTEQLAAMVRGEIPWSREVMDALKNVPGAQPYISETVEKTEAAAAARRPSGITVSEIAGPTRDLLVSLVRNFNAESIVDRLERMLNVLIEIKDGVYLLQPLEGPHVTQDAAVTPGQGMDVDMQLANRHWRRVRLAGTAAA